MFGLKRKSDMDAHGRTPLHNAAAKGQTGYARELLKQGADAGVKDQWGTIPLHYAALSGEVELLDLLAAAGAEIDAPDENNSLPLHYAVMANRRKACEFLIKKGSRVDSRDIFGQTPLDWVAGRGNPELLEPFASLEGKKDLDLPGLLNRYPLHRAANGGHQVIMEILLGKGARWDAVDDQGRIPLHWAARSGKKAAVHLLLSKGSPVDARDNAGQTPLHLAACLGHSDVVEYLLENHADSNARDKEGRTPLYLAHSYAWEKTAQQLIAKGAAAEKQDSLTPPLKKELKEKEAVAWHLGHCGWAVKTRNRLLIFDYWQKGPRPANGCLANGYIDPAEIKDLDVTVLVTHAHPDHYDPVIFQWEPVIKNITYIFGWDAQRGSKYIYMKKPREKTKIKDMKIYTVYCHHNDVPEVAYLVLADGLVFYHTGDYVGPLNSFKDDIDYLARQCGGVDIAFSGTTCETGRYTMERLIPKAAFPMHCGGTEFMYRGIVRFFGAKFPKTTFLAPENKGDRYSYLDGAIKEIR